MASIIGFTLSWIRQLSEGTVYSVRGSGGIKLSRRRHMTSVPHPCEIRANPRTNFLPYPGPTDSFPLFVVRPLKFVELLKKDADFCAGK
jgi:hypothetical protein